LIEQLLALLYILVSLLLLPYGYNCFVLVYGAVKYRSKGLDPVKNHPFVTIQLPIYNERFVVSRLLKAVGDLDWPRDKLEVLVLDDSTDDTPQIVDSEIDTLRTGGLDIRAIRRKERLGFKAGALQNALQSTRGRYIAIFDADFLPPPDFLEKVVPYLEADPRLGFVQSRLGHANRGYNNLTETIALAIDGHFIVEQAGRDEMSLITNFNGSGGMLRTKAVMDMGGWHTDILTEDLDMCYRMRIGGWGSKFLRDVVVPGEVPVDMLAFKNQQARWAYGGAQCARRLLRSLWRSTRFSLPQKVEATLHITNYFIYPLMFLSLLCTVILLAFNVIPGVAVYSPFNVLFSIGTFGASAMYLSSMLIQSLDIKEKLPYLSLLAAIGIGLSAQCAISVFKGLLSKKCDFVPTPKYNVRGKGDRITSKIQGPIRSIPAIEITMALYSLLGVYLALVNRIFPVAVSLSIYFAGYFIVIYYTLSNRGEIPPSKK